MGTYIRFIAILIVAIAAALFAPAIARASVTVDSVELMERTRVGRTTFNYTYRITATNNAPVVAVDAVAYLSLGPSDPMLQGVSFTHADEYGQNGANGTTLIDADVALGDIGAGQTVTSTDTYTLQQDRRIPFDPGALIWEVGYTASVKLSGLVTDQVIPFADLIVLVNRSESGRPIIESGRPIIESYGTTADSAGRYSIDVDFVADKDFVSITADGVDLLDFVALSSIVGSAGSLLEKATVSADSTGRAVVQIAVGGEDANALNVTHVSTALAQLAIRENGGEGFTNDEDLAAAQALVNTDELITVAAVLKTVIDNANIGLPPGITTTQQLLDTPGAFEAFLAVLQENFPDELQTAIDETIIDISTGYEAADIPDTLYLTLARENPFLNGANVFTFEQNGSGTHTGSSGETTDADWLINPAGDIVVTLNNPPEVESFPFNDVVGGQVRQLTSITELRIVRVAVGIQTDQVLLGSTTLQTFPDPVDPDGPGGDDPFFLPDIVTVNEPSPEFGYLAFDTSGIVPVVGAELPGESIALSYFHTDNNNQLSFPSEVGADLLVFGAGGSGTTARRGYDFTWTIDAVGRLIVTFDNGDRNEYVRYAQSDDGLVNLGLLIARYGDGQVSTRDVQGINMTDGTQFDEATLVNRKFRNGATILNPAFFGAVFDFNFLPGNVGCRAFFTSIDFDWQLNADDYVQILRFPGSGFERVRSWQAVTVVPGVLGDRYWVIENYDFYFFDGFPNDPTLTPGRISFYENVRDISGNTPPTAVDDQASTAPGTPVFIPVFANDTDPQGDSILILSWSSSALGGNVEETYDEDFSRITGLTYTPPAGVSGVTDTFTYTIADDSCGIAPLPATVSIDIGAAATVEYSWTGFMEPGSPTDPNPWDLSGDGGVGPVNDDGVPYTITVSVLEDAVDTQTGFGGLAYFPVNSVDLLIGGQPANVTNTEVRFEDNQFDSDRFLFLGDVELFGTTIPFVFTILILDSTTFDLSATPAQDPLPVFASTSTIVQSAIFGPVIATSLADTLLEVQTVAPDRIGSDPVTQGAKGEPSGPARARAISGAGPVRLAPEMLPGILRPDRSRHRELSTR